MIVKQRKMIKKRRILLKCLAMNQYEEIDITKQLIDIVKDIAPEFLKNLVKYKVEHFEIKPDVLVKAIENKIIDITETDLYNGIVIKDYISLYDGNVPEEIKTLKKEIDCIECISNI